MSYYGSYGYEWNEGYAAYCNGWSRSANPYDKYEQPGEFQAWLDGYDSAAWDD